ARSDQDDFNRWDAGRQLVIEAWVAFVKEGDHALIDPIERLFKSALDTQDVDPALTAEIICLPDDSQIIEALDEPADPVLVHQAGNTIRAELGRRLGPAIQPSLARLDQRMPYQPGGPQAAGRKLWCLLAQLLAYAGNESIVDGLTRRFVSADNLTDRMNCMSVAGTFARHNPSIFQSMLTIFRTDWQHEPLLLDQWFQVQARYGDLAAVAKLLEHEDFNLANPNRARSVLGVFSRLNPEAFHAEGGFELLARCVVSLDASNPQIASRLVLPLTRFQAWTTERQERAKHVLNGLNKVCQSSDCLEVIGKALK
ncbi:MAG: aminopeptidase N C-terminal domain-containing protein, partial [Litorivicinus sp.]